jgi:hypothetical protein
MVARTAGVMGPDIRGGQGSPRDRAAAVAEALDELAQLNPLRPGERQACRTRYRRVQAHAP